MGRKKKVTPVIQQPVTIEYSGKVTLSIETNKKVLSKKVYKNNGCKSLFECLTYCLAGEYGAADTKRPGTIQLYNCTATLPGDANIPELKDCTAASLIVPLESQPIITDPDTTNTIQAKIITFHFRVPAAYIVSNSTQFNVLVLRPVGMTEKNMSAYITLAENSAWKPQTLSTQNQNYNLLVDWEMTIGNAA